MLVVSEHTSFREELAAFLERDPGITVTCRAGSLQEASTILDGVDLAVVDYDLPAGDVASLIHDLTAANPEGVLLLLLGPGAPPNRALAAVKPATAGIRSITLAETIDILKRLSRCKHSHQPAGITAPFRLEAGGPEQHGATGVEALTPREREVLQVLVQGLSDKEIARLLGVKRETVRTHMVNILAKLGVESRLQALVCAIRHGIVSLD